MSATKLSLSVAKPEGDPGAARSATHSSAMRFISWDIETDTSGGFGLDPNRGGIVSIAARMFGLNSVSGDRVSTSDFYMTASDPWAEADLLASFDDWVADKPSCLLVGWNSTCFDAPFVFRRAEILNVNIGLRLSFNPAIVPKYEPTPGFDGGYDHHWRRAASLDVAVHCFDAGWCADNNVVFSLKPVAQHHGLEPVEVDREQIHLLSPSELRAYNFSDVDVTADLFAQWARALAAGSV